MSAAFAGILAGAMLEFHGVIGQSAGPSEEPLPFTGVTSLVELPGNRVVFAGDDGMLYELYIIFPETAQPGMTLLAEPVQ